MCAWNDILVINNLITSLPKPCFRYCNNLVIRCFNSFKNNTRIILWYQTIDKMVNASWFLLILNLENVYHHNKNINFLQIIPCHWLSVVLSYNMHMHQFPRSMNVGQILLHAFMHFCGISSYFCYDMLIQQFPSSMNVGHILLHFIMYFCEISIYFCPLVNIVVIKIIIIQNYWWYVVRDISHNPCTWS